MASNLIQVVSIKGPAKTREAVLSFLKCIRHETTANREVTMTGGSITTGDLEGYCTTLIEVPEDTPREKMEDIGRALANIMVGKYEIMKSSGAHGWYWTGTDMTGSAVYYSDEEV